MLCGGVSKKLLPAQSGAEDVLSVEINYCNRSAACPAFPSLGSELASLLQIVSHVQCATARGIDKAHQRCKLSPAQTARTSADICKMSQFLKAPSLVAVFFVGEGSNPDAGFWRFRPISAYLAKS